MDQILQGLDQQTISQMPPEILNQFMDQLAQSQVQQQQLQQQQQQAQQQKQIDQQQQGFHGQAQNNVNSQQRSSQNHQQAQQAQQQQNFMQQQNGGFGNMMNMHQFKWTNKIVKKSTENRQNHRVKLVKTRFPTQ